MDQKRVVQLRGILRPYGLDVTYKENDGVNDERVAIGWSSEVRHFYAIREAEQFVEGFLVGVDHRKGG